MKFVGFGDVLMNFEKFGGLSGILLNFCLNFSEFLS